MRQAPSRGHLQACGLCWDIESCSTGVSLPQKGEVASLLEELSFLLLRAELWPQAHFAGWGGREGFLAWAQVCSSCSDAARKSGCVRKTPSSLQKPGLSSGAGWGRAQHADISMHTVCKPHSPGSARPLSPGHRNTSWGLRGQGLASQELRPERIPRISGLGHRNQRSPCKLSTFSTRGLLPPSRLFPESQRNLCPGQSRM